MLYMLLDLKFLLGTVVVPGRLWFGTGSGAAARGACGAGKAHFQFPGDFTQHNLSLQQSIPIPAISPVLSHAQHRQIELVSTSKS